MILYGCPATGTVSLSVPSLVRLSYCRYGLGFIVRLMPVERQQGLLINRLHECCATNRVDITHTSTLRTASSTQLTVQQYTEYNTVRTHDVFLERLTSLSIFICLLLIRKLYKYFIYGPEAHTKTSGNVRATVETQQLTVDRTAPYGVWSNSHTPTS